jgi:dTDP-4-amino-4,6-dideoxygalactose transaminase
MIPVFRPLLDECEILASKQVLEVGWLGMGRNVGQFEEAVTEYLGLSDRYCVAVSTGHAALHLGLLLMGIRPGDEVITPSFNNAADFQAILATGAQPVFCDVEEATLNIDLDKAEKLIGPKTRAITTASYVITNE